MLTKAQRVRGQVNSGATETASELLAPVYDDSSPSSEEVEPKTWMTPYKNYIRDGTLP